MDNLDNLLDRIIQKVHTSGLSEAEKADVFASLSLGMRRLVWPILLSRIPKETLDHLIGGKEPLAVDQYTALLNDVLKDPQTPKEIYEELIAALEEIESLIVSRVQ